MKFYVIAILLASCALYSTASQLENPVSGKNLAKLGNAIDTLVTNALEYVRSLFKKYEPFSVPDPPQQTVSGDDVDLTINFSNLKVSNASDFEINKISNNLLSLSATFNVSIPVVNIEGDFSVNGTFESKTVDGSGTFELGASNLVTGGTVKLQIVSYYLQMKSLSIEYDIGDLSFSADGLSVDGMTTDQVQSVLTSSFLSYFQDNEEFVSSQVASYVLSTANDIMYGKSLVDLMNWLKEFISGSVIS